MRAGFSCYNRLWTAIKATALLTSLSDTQDSRSRTQGEGRYMRSRPLQACDRKPAKLPCTFEATCELSSHAYANLGPNVSPAAA